MDLPQWTLATYRRKGSKSRAQIGKMIRGEKSSGAFGKTISGETSRTIPLHMTSTVFRIRFAITVIKKATLPQIAQTKEQATDRMAKATEQVAKAILERVMVHTSLLEDGKHKADGREDTKGTKAKARAKGTRAHVGDADKSATNTASAKINSRSSKSSKFSKPGQVQRQFQNNRTTQ